MRRTVFLGAGVAALLGIGLAAGCAGTQATIANDSLQTIAAEVAIARVIEQTSNPRRTAIAILELSARASNAEDMPEDPMLILSAIHDQLDYASRPASERLLIDALAESIAQDFAATVPGRANSWIEASTRAARAVLAAGA
jgi:hypothetical protein